MVIASSGREVVKAANKLPKKELFQCMVAAKSTDTNGRQMPAPAPAPATFAAAKAKRLIATALSGKSLLMSLICWPACVFS